MKHFLIPSLLLALLSGCASVDTKEEWNQLAGVLPIENCMVWTQSEQDENLVKGLVQEKIKYPLTQDDALAVGLINNKELQSAFENIGVTKADLTQAGLFTNPNLSALFRFPFIGSGIDIEAEGLFNVTDLWLLPLRKQAAQQALDKALMEIADTVLQKRRDIKVAYNNLFFNQLALQETKDFLDKMSLLSVEAQKRHEFGYMREDDTYSAEIMEYQAAILLSEAQAGVNIEKAKLAQLLGVPSTVFSIKEESNWTTEYQVDPDVAFNVALNNRFDLKVAHIKIAEQERVLLLNKRKFFKEVHLGASFEKGVDNNKTLGPAFSLEIPIFDQNQAQIAKADYFLKMARKDLYALEDKVRMEIAVNAHSLEHLSYKADTIHGQIIPLQEKIVNFLNYWNQQMQVNQFIFLQSQKDLINLKIEHIQSIKAFQNNLHQLEYSLGGLLP